jgi:gluconokinase
VDPLFLIIMGVSGSGKTTVGRLLAARLHCPFYDADHFHPPENIAKMAAGRPLTDADRSPWLARLQELIAHHLAQGQTAVLACSALKKSYRDHLRPENGRAGGTVTGTVLFIYLHGSFELIWERMQSRPGHYMKAEMLQSPFDALEPPSQDEALLIDISNPVEEIVEKIATLCSAIW